MPNHIHVLVKQLDALSNVVRILKGGSAHIVNSMMNRKGKVWSSDYFDKVVRTEEQFRLTYKYMQENAFKVGLIDADTRFYGVYGPID